jgi:ketosteroid isomerase-like protein
MMTTSFFLLLIGVLSLSPTAVTTTDDAQEIKTLAALDTQYQLAVKNNDAATMDKILADDFIVVLGNGVTENKADLLRDARTKRIIYEIQDDTLQTARVWGNTGVITALLTIKGKYTETGKTFERQLWFSDTYVRTPSGWRYVFGQASLPLPKAN